MLVANFGPTTSWLGRAITQEDGQFVLEGHGAISARAVMEYDRQGHLIWVNDGTRAWVGSLAGRTADPTPVPVKIGQATIEPEPVQPRLLACPACEHQVSSHARACPNCGHPIVPSGLAASAASIGGVVSRVPLSFAGAGAAVGRARRQVVLNRRTVGASIVLLAGVLVALGSVLPWITAEIGWETMTRNGFQLGENNGLSLAGFLVLFDGLILCWIALSKLLHFGTLPYVTDSPIVVGVVGIVYIMWVFYDLDDFIANLNADGIPAREGSGGGVVLLGCLLAIVGGVLLRSARKRAQREQLESA